MTNSSSFPTSVDTFAVYNNAGELDDTPTHGDRHDHMAAAIVAVETELLNGTAGYEVLSHKGAANGYASLDGTGKVPATQLPAGSGGGVSTLGPATGGHITVTGTATAPLLGVDTAVELNTNKGAASGYAGLDTNAKVPPTQSYGAYLISYNAGTSSWPARPVVGTVAAGQAFYVSGVAGVANPTDTQIGDIVFIPAVAGAPVFTAVSPPAGAVGAAYSYTFAATNNPTSFAVATGTAPAGLTLNTTSGVLSGTPTTAATYTFTVSATNAAYPATSSSISVTIAASSTTFALNNTVANWANAGNATTIASDATNTHGGSNTIKVTAGGAAQSYATISWGQAATAGVSYTTPTLYCRAGATTRKARVMIQWMDSSFVTLSQVWDSTDVNLTSGAWVTAPTVAATAPAGTANVAIQLVYQTTDGSNLPGAESFNWSTT